MHEIRALAAREWGLIRRSALGALLFTSLGVAVLFLLCRAPDRYRLLADPMLLRTVALPLPALAGLWLSFLSFAGEMRSGTWDSLLLLPCSRRAVLSVKLALGLLSVAASIALPMLGLRQLLELLPATGGPVLTVPELFRHSLLPRGLLLGSIAYLAGASAAFLARDRRAVAFAPFAAPLVLLSFWMGESHTSRTMLFAFSLASSAVLLPVWGALLFAEIGFVGRHPASSLIAARALLPAPITLAFLLFFGLLTHDLYLRRSGPIPVGESEETAPMHGISQEGQIIASRNPHRFLSMYSFVRRDAPDAEPGSRFWTPQFVGRSYQLFVSKHADVLLAYHTGTGVFLGCLGADGLKPSGCAPFDGPPYSLSFGKVAVILTPSRVLSFDRSTGALIELLHGPVERRVSVSIDTPGRDEEALALQVGRDLVLLSEPPPADPDAEPSDEDDEPAAPAPAAAQPPASGSLVARVVCRDAAQWGPLARIHGNERFLGVEIDGPGKDDETLVVCRDGQVQEHRTFPPDPSPAAPEPTFDSRLVAMARLAGPVATEVLCVLKPPSGLRFVGGESGPAEAFAAARPSTWAIALGGALLLALPIGRQRRSPLALLLALAFGPAYVLSYLLLLWRRSWLGPTAA